MMWTFAVVLIYVLGACLMYLVVRDDVKREGFNRTTVVITALFLVLWPLVVTLVFVISLLELLDKVGRKRLP